MDVITYPCRKHFHVMTSSCHTTVATVWSQQPHPLISVHSFQAIWTDWFSITRFIIATNWFYHGVLVQTHGKYQPEVLVWWFINPDDLWREENEKQWVIAYCDRVSSGQGKVREIPDLAKVREKSGNFVEGEGKNEYWEKSGKSQGICI